MSPDLVDKFVLCEHQLHHRFLCYNVTALMGLLMVNRISAVQ